jgi:hypothetical protein
MIAAAPRFAGSHCVVVPPLTPNATGLADALQAEGLEAQRATDLARFVSGCRHRGLMVDAVAVMLPRGVKVEREKRAHELLRAFGFEARP